MSHKISKLLVAQEKLLMLVRSRGLEPPRVAPLAPQASASANSATTASGRTPDPKGPRRPGNGAACNKLGMPVQGWRDRMTTELRRPASPVAIPARDTPSAKIPAAGGCGTIEDVGDIGRG